MTQHINIEGIKFYAYHGCLEHEAQTGGNFVVDVYMACDFSVAAKTDDLAKTIDYCVVYDICKKEMMIRSKLIEPVCQRMYDALKKAFPMIGALHIKLTKISPPVNGDVERVSVEIKD